MWKNKKIISYWSALFLLIVAVLPIYAITDSAQLKKDTINLQKYIAKLQIKQCDHVVLKMSDTLMEMANKAKLEKFKIIAVCYKMEYFNNIHKLDSMKYYAEKIKRMAKKAKLPEYYYFACSRVTYSLINSEKWFSAALEAKKIRNEAIVNDNKQGIITAMNMQDLVYSNLGLYQSSVRVNKKIIEILEKYDIRDYNRNIYYLQLAKAYNKLEMPDKALEIVRKAEKKVFRSEQLPQIYHIYSITYIKLKDYKNAKKYLDLCSSSMKKYGTPDVTFVFWCRASCDLFIAQNNLTALKQIVREKGEFFKNLTSRQLALIYQMLGDDENSNKYFKETIKEEEIFTEGQKVAILVDIMGYIDNNEESFKKLSQKIELEELNQRYIYLGLGFAFFVILIFVAKLVKKILKGRKIRNYLRLTEQNIALLEDMNRKIAEQNEINETENEDMIAQNESLESQRKEITEKIKALNADTMNLPTKKTD